VRCFRLKWPVSFGFHSRNSEFRKLFLTTHLKQDYYNPIPSQIRGAFRDRHGRWVRDAVDVAAPLTNGAKADGEVVWF